MLRRQRRVFSLLLLFSVLVSIVLLRLAFIQAGQGKRLAQEAVKQRAQTVVLAYKRGDILDRHGVSLLGGGERNVLAVFPTLLARSDAGTRETILAAIPRVSAAAGPFIAFDNLSPAEEEYFREYYRDGLIVVTAYNRYGEGALATHLVGHIGPGDGEGKVGLEQFFNTQLQGNPSILAAVVDGRNRLVEGLGYRLWEIENETAPPDLVLTIDSRIQFEVERVMDEKIRRGAVVVLDPQNGEILAMASRPNYYQAHLSHYMNNMYNYATYLETLPFINRSILSYHPASIFKIVVAAAAFDSAGYALLHRFHCPGYIRVGDRVFRCSQGRAHGEVDLSDAFAHSCNTTFIQVALELGKDRVYEYAQKMGLGEKSNLPLGNAAGGEESAGRLPLPEEIRYEGELALIALGQGGVETTPLQVARLTAIAANGGYLVEPRLVKGFLEGERLSLGSFSPSFPRRAVSPLTASRLRYLMMKVVDQGTGKEARSEQVILGGKTGTAETGRANHDGAPLYYFWFSGLLPLEDCRAVVTVFIEEPRGYSAAAVFKKIAEAIHPFL
ncbi:MAG: penicillin-binding protein 2 [Bacillota bacterium]